MIKTRIVRAGPVKSPKPPKAIPPHVNELLRALPADSPARKIVEDLVKNGVTLSEQDCELIKKIALSGIDLTDPKNKYHLDMLRALFQKEKIIYAVTNQLGIDLAGIRKIKVEVFRVEDISLDIGTRRDVDLVTLETDRGKINFTVSLDKEPYRHVGESHSQQEANVLMSQNTSQGRWATQRCYGYVTVRIGGRPHGAIIKEFLPGGMQGNYTAYIGMPEEDVISDSLRIIAFAHGRMIGNILQTSGGFPIDMTPENVIVNEDNGITCRTCDLSGVDRDGSKWTKYLDIDLTMWQKYGWHYLFGIVNELNEVKRDSLLALIQGKVGAPMIESLKAACREVAALERRGNMTSAELDGMVRRILEEH